MSETNLSAFEEFEASKEQLRCAISGVYDIQTLRISTGNRLVANFFKKAGVEPSKSPEEELSDKENKLIKELVDEYKLITDAISQGIISSKKLSSAEKRQSAKAKVGADTTSEELEVSTYSRSRVVKAIEALDKTEEPLKYVRSNNDFLLVQSYMMLQNSENVASKVVEGYVKKHPMYEAFFKNVLGCGPLLSGVCLAYLDPYKARHVSSFYRYVGLDTVQDTDSNGNKLYYPMGGRKKDVLIEKVIYTDDQGENYFGKVKKTDEIDADGKPIFRGEEGQVVTPEPVFDLSTGEQIYVHVKTGVEYKGLVMRIEHGRRKGDTEMFKYVNKDGEEAWKRGLTYNPFVKTKLVGVLAGSFIKQGSKPNAVYRQVYDDYKNRLLQIEAQKPEEERKSAGNINAMAKRYMIKQFLRDLWVTWRTVENLPVDEPYEVAKLGNAPHKYNEYQVKMAELSRQRLQAMNSEE